MFHLRHLLPLSVCLLVTACGESDGERREKAYEIFRAIGARNAATARDLIHEYRCVDYPDSEGWSMMHSAAFWKLPEVVDALLDEGADINILHNQGGFRPLDCVLGDPEDLGAAQLWAFRQELSQNLEFIRFMRERGAKGEVLDRTLVAMEQFQYSAAGSTLDAIQRGILGGG